LAGRRPRLFLIILSAIAAIGPLAGCGVDPTPSVSSRHVQPLSEKTTAELDKKNMGARSPILIRIFKEEAELELWKENDTGRFALFRTYPICRWSGELGPKIKSGDRQAPEGFYSITPEQMNPNSNYYLAFNIGFPNAYDKANGRTGGFLMVHGDCASVGCYAMTDEQIAEIYALARESFAGGQKSFQVQAYPFRMTPLNMARYRNSPHAEFWKMLKVGHDHFDVTHLAPKVDVCERRYVFDAETSAGFSPLERCPVYKMREDVEAAVREKQRRDEVETARLIGAGIPIAPTNGGQGGMNRIFLAAISQAGAGVAIRTPAGTIPSHVHPPSRTASQGTDTRAAEPSAASENGLVNSGTATSADQIGTLLSDRLQ
jgi:murein L,D-transpeptidase YafK